MSLAVFSLTQRCPWQCLAWLSAVLGSISLDSALSLAVFCLTQRCPGQYPAWLSAVPDSVRSIKWQISLRIHKSFIICLIILSFGIELSMTVWLWTFCDTVPLMSAKCLQIQTFRWPLFCPLFVFCFDHCGRIQMFQKRCINVNYVLQSLYCKCLHFLGGISRECDLKWICFKCFNSIFFIKFLAPADLLSMLCG